MQPLVSIIVPCRKIDEYAKECIEYCKRLDYENFEVLLLPDDVSENVDRVRVISTGCVTPGRKRNIGVTNAEGDFCAFIDSDAYPSKDWLRNSMKYFDDPMVAGVGGPGLTPGNDSLMQRASGYVLSSLMVGSISSRYKVERVSESDDIHSCNFIARKMVLKEAGGWNERYWPGEDTLICLAIKRLGKKLVEASDVVVYHHRRSLFRPHLTQVSRFGEHRGFFAAKFPANSLKPTYFFPSLLILSLLAGVLLSFLFSFFVYIVVLGVAAYLALSLVATTLQVRKVKLILLVWSGIIVTHIAYGVFFLSGLVKRDLKR